MKKIIMISLTIFSVLIGSAAFSQEPGNAFMLTNKGQIDVGLDGTYIFNQHFGEYDLKWEASNGTSGVSRVKTDFKDDRFVMATLNYGLTDCINLSGSLGMVDGGTWNESGPGGRNPWEASMERAFVWAVGAKGKLFEMKNGPAFGFETRYLRYDNRGVKDWVFLPLGQREEDFGTQIDEKVDYWQFDAIAKAYWIVGRFTPYIGAGFNYAHVKEKGVWIYTNNVREVYDASFNNRKKYSAVFGVAFEPADKFKVNLSGTFLSSTALNLSLTYAF